MKIDWIITIYSSGIPSLPSKCYVLYKNQDTYLIIFIIVQIQLEFFSQKVNTIL